MLPLKAPFFILEYDREKTCFMRKIPEGAGDLGSGRFRLNGEIYELPDGTAELKILEQPEIRGRDLLSLVRRGYNPLIKSGPVMAERGDRLMELGLLGDTYDDGKISDEKKSDNDIKKGHSVAVILRYGKTPEKEWLPLDGLPNYKLYENRIYEIIPDEVLSLFRNDRKNSGILILNNTEIPSFADDHARLIYIFADEHLYRALAQESVFIEPEKLSLVLRYDTEKEKPGKRICYPAVKYEDKYYSALALSRHYQEKYLPIKNRWIRRENLERLGIGPLGCYINGKSLAPFTSDKKNIAEKEFYMGYLEYMRPPNPWENRPGYYVSGGGRFSVQEKFGTKNNELNAKLRDENFIKEIFSKMEEFAPKESSEIVYDLFLHKKYVEENHNLRLQDFLFFTGVIEKNLEITGEEIMNEIDIILRKNYGKKLLEFFYPVPPARESFDCTDLSEKNLVFIAEWLSYSRHAPFKKFLSMFSARLEHNALPKDLLELIGEAPVKKTEKFKINLENDKIDRLRKESEAVTGLLSVEKDFDIKNESKDEPHIKIKKTDFHQEKEQDDKKTIAGIIVELDRISLGCLELFVNGNGDLDAYARDNGTMAQFIIDEINGIFIRDYGDLLILTDDNLDKKPVIQEEYRDEVLWALTFRKD